jgi:hypothetical protein
MTLGDFEQQTTLSICQGNIDQHPIVCGEQDNYDALGKNSKAMDDCLLSSTARIDTCIPVGGCVEKNHVRPRDLESHTTCSSRLYDRENEVAVGDFRLLPRLKSA